MKVFKILCVLLCVVSAVYAQTPRISMNKARLVPQLLNYQGYLTDSFCIPITDNLDMTFKIFDAVSSGNELWSETQLNVPVERGVFSVILGEGTAIPDSVFSDFTSTWLELTLEGPQTLTPRTRITSVGYAYRSTYSDTAGYAINGAGDNDWAVVGNVLYPSSNYGLSMRSSNALFGTYDTTHVCFGTACTTGVVADSHPYCTVSGGKNNTAYAYSSISGGYYNHAYGYFSNIGGGYSNKADTGFGSVIAGGGANTITGDYSVIPGGYNNAISADYSFLFGIRSSLSTDSTFMVDLPHIRFGDESSGYEFPAGDGSGGEVMLTDGSGQLTWSTLPDDLDWTISGNDMYSNVSGNVGISTTSPGAKLDVAGHIWQTGTGHSVFLGERAGASDDLSNNNNVFVGFEAGYMNTTGFSNTACGCQALYSDTSGAANTANGYRALMNNINGNYNTACGFQSLQYNTEGTCNTACGAFALEDNSGGSNNTACGAYALKDNSTGNSNIAHGTMALCTNTTGSYNIAYGYRALFSNTTGSYNIASGNLALTSNTTANHNVAIGEKALFTQSYDNGGTPWDSWNIAIGDSALFSNQPMNTVNGRFNTALGHSALRSNTIGMANTACGSQVLCSNTNGWFNTASGSNALYSNTEGSANTANGYHALDNNMTGDFNTAIGVSAGPTGSNFENTTALGYGTHSTASNRVHIGNASVDWIGGQVTWNTYSDERATNNVRADIPGLAFITQLEPVSFNWDTRALNNLIGVVDTAQWDGKYDIEKKRISGFLAQDVAQAARECGYGFSGIDSTANVYSLSYAQFVVPLVKAVQELQTQIEKQAAEIARLQALITELEEKIR